MADYPKARQRPPFGVHMIDRDLLEDMGFVLGTGWPGEVWVYEGSFWVYFYDGGAMDGDRINALTATRAEFFTKFIASRENDPA